MKILRNLMVMATGALLMTGCQIYNVVKYYTDREEGRLITLDGKEYTGRVLMPKFDTKNVRITLNDGTKQTVGRDNVKVLEVWKKTHPDKVYPLIVRKFYTDYRSKKPYKSPAWMTPRFIGKNLMICVRDASYRIQSNGTLYVTTIDRIGVDIIAFKNGDDVGMTVGGNIGGYLYSRKALTFFLADDPVLCKKIEKMRMSDEDWQTIVDEYEPGRK